MQQRMFISAWIGFAMLAGTGCGKSKAREALEKCEGVLIGDASLAEGLEVCYQGFKEHTEAKEWTRLTEQFDRFIDHVCKSSIPAKGKLCDSYCPKRIAQPGPKNKTATLSLCVEKGYGDLEGNVAARKPDPVSPSSPVVIEACVTECRPLAGSDPKNPAYQTCFADCKVRKSAELNMR